MEDFRAVLAEKRELINRRIDEILSSGFEQSEANELVKYTFTTGGKRLRPVLLIMSCEAVGGDAKSSMDAAVAVEFIHAASLIFDDLIDKDRLRRNFPTTQAAFNDDKAIGSGLFLASKGVQILSDYRNSKITKMIGWALVELSKGEILDIISDIAIDVDHYVTVADLKTGSLFSAGAGIGGIIGGGTTSEINALYKYGRLLGVAFQIRDDILDLSGVGQRRERANLVLAHYLGGTTKEERVSQILEKPDGVKQEQALEAIRDKAVAFAVKTSREQVEKAKSELKSLRESDKKRVLEQLADFALERTE